MTAPIDDVVYKAFRQASHENILTHTTFRKRVLDLLRDIKSGIDPKAIDLDVLLRSFEQADQKLSKEEDPNGYRNPRAVPRDRE